MGKDNQLEVYRQRYETYRHLDKIRWRTVQYLIAVLTATSIVIQVSNESIEWWFTVLLSLTLICLSFAIHKTSAGIRKNQEVLSNFAKKIGDKNIPDISNKWNSVFTWLSLLVGLVGFVLLLSRLCKLIGGFN